MTQIFAPRTRPHRRRHVEDKPAPIGAHLAVLNLFREPDGSVQITVAMADGAMKEWEGGKAAASMNLPPNAKPIDFVEELVVEAAGNMEKRRGN